MRLDKSLQIVCIELIDKNVFFNEIVGGKNMKIIDVLKNAAKKEVMEEVIQEGMEKGMRKGEIFGRIKAMKSVALRLLKQGMSIKQIASITELTSDEIMAL